MRVHFKILAALGLFLLAGCGGLNVEKTPLRDLPDLPPRYAHPAPIGFREIRFAVPTGTPTVSQSPKGFLGLIACDWPYTMIQTGIRSRNFPDDNFRSIFLETLKSQGYDIAGDPGRFFDEEEDEMRAAYAVGGEITDVKIDLCKRSNIWGIDSGVTGEASVAVNWSVFDLLNRRPAYKTTTKGYGALDDPNQEGTQLLFESALESAIHNLGADPQFRSLVFFGETPALPPAAVPDPHEEPAARSGPDEDILLPGVPLSAAPAEGRLEELLNGVVMIEAGGGFGSGFFITAEGHILTNAHVVGNASRVRVVTSGKQQKLIGDVVRIDRRRDVALIRLESVPESLRITVLPLRFDERKIGEDVYAIGAPRRRQLQDTVTRGIVSAHRFDRRERQAYIQADVDIYGGNSGGPLLDANGNIIGISTLGFLVSDDTDILGGLNWFIPIRDALERLDIPVPEPVQPGR